MPTARLVACSGNAWLRPDGYDATLTSGALLPAAEAAGPRPIGAGACALRRPSVAREPSLSLERQQAVLALRFRSSLL